jgi:hypothetical protein
MQFHNGAVIGCGIVSGTIAPLYNSAGQNLSAFTEKCAAESAAAETAALQRDHPSLIVWGSTQEHNSIVVDTPTGSKVLVSGTPEWESVMRQRILTRVGQFIATGAKVILLLEPPSVHAGGPPGPNADDAAYGRMNTLLKEVAARHPGQVGVVNLATRVCPSGPPCPFVVDGFGSTEATITQAIRPDLTHYLPAGALWVARWLVPQIEAEAKGLS